MSESDASESFVDRFGESESENDRDSDGEYEQRPLYFDQEGEDGGFVVHDSEYEDSGPDEEPEGSGPAHVDIIDTNDPAFGENSLQFFILNCYSTISAMQGHNAVGIQEQLSEFIGENANYKVASEFGFMKFENFLDAEFNKSIFRKKIEGLHTCYYAKPHPRFAQMRELLDERTRYENSRMTPEERKRKEDYKRKSYENAKKHLKNRYELLKLIRDCGGENDFTDITVIMQAHTNRTAEPFCNKYWSDRFGRSSMLKTFSQHFSRDIVWAEYEKKPLHVKMIRSFEASKKEIVEDLKGFGVDTSAIEAESVEKKPQMNQDFLNFFVNPSKAKKTENAPFSENGKAFKTSYPKGDIMASLSFMKLKDPDGFKNKKAEDKIANVAAPNDKSSEVGVPAAAEAKVKAVPSPLQSEDSNASTPLIRYTTTVKRKEVSRAPTESSGDDTMSKQGDTGRLAECPKMSPVEGSPSSGNLDSSSDESSAEDTSDDNGGHPLFVNTAPRPVYSSLATVQRTSNTMITPKSSELVSSGAALDIVDS